MAYMPGARVRRTADRYDTGTVKIAHEPHADGARLYLVEWDNGAVTDTADWNLEAGTLPPAKKFILREEVDYEVIAATPKEALAKYLEQGVEHPDVSFTAVNERDIFDENGVPCEAVE